jgi:hypothetical protein
VDRKEEVRINIKGETMSIIKQEAFSCDRCEGIKKVDAARYGIKISIVSLNDAAKEAPIEIESELEVCKTCAKAVQSVVERRITSKPTKTASDDVEGSEDAPKGKRKKE